MSEKTVEFHYLTPPQEIEQVVLPILGHIDIDPCDHPDSHVPAKRKMFGADETDDGYSVEWIGNAFLNPSIGERLPKGMTPPFGWRPLSRWVAKAVVESGKGSTILALLPAYTDRVWFHQYVAKSAAFCLLASRVKYHLPGTGLKAQPKGAHQYALWTPDSAVAERFCSVLDNRGLVVRPG